MNTSTLRHFQRYATALRGLLRLPCTLAAVCLVVPAWAAQAPPDFSQVEVRPIRVADNFYVIDESAVHGGAISILIGTDGIVVIDTGVAPLAPKVAAAIRQLSAQPIRYVINTHAHVDETGGNEYFARLGATIIARTQVRDSMLHPRMPAAGAATDGRQARQQRSVAAAAVPTLAFAADMTVHAAGQDLRLITVPRAHTDGDALIWIPGLDVIVAGDVLRAHEFPSIGRPDGGTLPGMFDALARLIGLAGPATRIVTAHGAIVDRGVAIEQRDFLLTSRDRIAALIGQGKSADEVIAADVTAGLGVQALPGHITAEPFTRDVYAELKALK